MKGGEITNGVVDVSEKTVYDSSSTSSNNNAEDGKSVTSDDELLLSMGKRPNSSASTDSGRYALTITIFDIGGPFSVVWGTLFVAVGQTLLMTSLAEFCGLFPTAGGQQYYTQVLANDKTRAWLSYLVGWAVLVGEISTGSSCALNSAQIIESFVEVTHPNYDWQPWLTWLVYTIFLIGPIVINLMPKYLPALNVLGAFWTIGGGIAWAISFGIMAPKHDVNFIFKTFINNSGYGSNVWVFIMSFYSPMYGLYGTDGMMHLVEEMRNPARLAPRVMVYSMLFASVTSFLAAILMMWTAGSWQVYMEASQPYMNWWMDILRSVYGGGVFCALIMIGLNFFIIAGTNTAVSRLAWSMARDKAFPYSEYLARVSKRFGIPLRAMLAILIVDLVIGLIVLGSDLAFESIISGGGVTLQVGYVTPVIIVLCRGRGILPPRLHFDLGRWGYFINITNVCWSTLVIIMYLCPLYVPINAMNISWMNWSVLIVGATILLPGVWWFWPQTGARHRYIKDSNSVIEDNIVVIDGQAVPASEVTAVSSDAQKNSLVSFS